jgi:polysaccharide biosynthesis protein PslH
MAAMRILILAPRHPFPAERGDQSRVLHLVEAFGPRADVTVVCFGAGEWPSAAARLVPVRRTVLGTVLANLRRPGPLMPLQARLYLDRGMDRAVAGELAGGGYDVVHATTARLAAYLPARSSGVHRHLDLIDALSINMETRASGERGLRRLIFGLESRLLRRYEAAAVASADSASLVSEGDRTAPGLERVAIIPMGVDLDRFPFRPSPDGPPVLLFFGNLGYFHNVEPARFVATEVLPRVRAEIPEASLRIVGARPARAVQALHGLPGVEVVGPVADMAEALHAARVAVVPMFTGSGIKTKVLEAFSSGTPVVANRLGIQGVEGAEAGVHFLPGEGAEALAASCVTVLRDRERAGALATAGRALVETRYTWAAQADRFFALYRRGATGPGAG